MDTSMKPLKRSIQAANDCPSCDPCPTKKQKTIECLEKVLLLNELGVECHRYGNIEEAKSSFNEALVKVNAEGYEYRVCITKKSSDGTESKNETLLATDCRDCEYDEGMQAYNSPLHLSGKKCHVSLVATLFYNIGQTYIRINGFDDAKLCFRRALEVITGYEHISASSDSLESTPWLLLHNLGYCCFRLGQLKESLKYYHEALDQVRAADNSEELDLGIAANCVAMIQLRNKTCDSKKCMELLQLSLESNSSSLGPLSSGVATVLFNIAQAHFFRAEYQEALSSFEKSLCLRRRLIADEKSVSISVVIFGIGQTYHRLGFLDRAIASFDEYLDRRGSADKGVGSQDEITILTALNSKAIILRERGDLDEAQALFEKALKRGLEAFGGYHYNLAPTLINFGSLCVQMGKTAAALTLFEECLKVQGQNPGSTHAEIINTLLNIADVHWQVGNYYGAWSTFKEILTLQVQSVGASSLPVASTLSSMAFIYSQIGQYDDALELYQEALRVRRECYEDQEHPDIIATLNTAGLILCKLKAFKLARESFEECIRSRVRALGPDHVDVSILMHNLAAAHVDMGDEEEAISLFKKALSIREKQEKTDQSLMASTIHHLGQAYQLNGKLEEAGECFKRGLEIERNEGKDIIVIRKLLNLIANINMMLANVDEMMEGFIEASRLTREGEREDFLSFLLVTGHNFFDLSRLHPKCAPVA